MWFHALRCVILLLTVSGVLSVPNGSAAPVSSADQSILVYISPRPSARNVSPTTAIAVRQGSPLDPRSISPELFVVSGSTSGTHGGTTRLSDDQRTLLFYTDQPFAYNEVISVSIRPGLRTVTGEPIRGTDYQFTTLERPVTDVRSLRAGAADAYSAGTLQRTTEITPGPYLTHPELPAPPLSIVTPAQNTAAGLLFLTPNRLHSLLIADETGEPVYMQQFPDTEWLADFKRQVVNGRPYLTYHSGTFYGFWTAGRSYVLDERYRLVDVWTIENGYGTDLHEFLLLDNGHALLLGYMPVPTDLRPYGGPENGTVFEMIIQEQDSNKNVIFEWRGTDHIPLSELEQPITGPVIDPLHTNAIEVDHDGNLLLSHRGLAEITKIDRNTGEIIWRLGGKYNQFSFTNDEGFSAQHDIRRLPNGHLTLYDNGIHKSPQHSRAVEYQIDETTKTVTRVWQYPEDTNRYSFAAGNAQRLSNGNTLIGWGSAGWLTEVRPDGSTALDIRLVNNASYRAFRFPWEALPAVPPRVAVRPEPNPSNLRLYMSWNGATGITGYEIYAGPSLDELARIKTVPRTGFETSTIMAALADDTCVFKVRPVHKDDRLTLDSHEVYWPGKPACGTQQFLPALRQ